MSRFVGRNRELRVLQAELDACIATGEGRFITIRGRRQVGKTALVEQWLSRYRGPSLFFEAHGYTETRELERFREAIAMSPLPSAASVGGLAFADWQAALTTAATAAERATPSIIVLDEFPDLCAKVRDAQGQQAPSPQEGAIRAAWRHLQKQPVILVLVGSDLSMMSRITSYGAPLFQRPTRQLVVEPLSPREVSQLSGRSSEDALDSYLVTGGFPRIVGLWEHGSLEAFLARELADPSSEFVAAAERILDAELPSAVAARTVLSVIGEGQMTHSSIVQGTGIAGNNLGHPLRSLSDKGIIGSALPLSTRRSDARRYHVADPYLRFWLRFIEPIRSQVARGIGASNAARIAHQFPDFAGRAIEPLVRSAIERMCAAGDERFAGARVVGGYWTRDHQVEVDLVGTDRDTPGPKTRIAFAGTVKWRTRQPLDGSDVAALEAALVRLPGAGQKTPLVAVSRRGFSGIAGPVAQVTADEILAAFSASPSLGYGSPSGTTAA